MNAIGEAEFYTDDAEQARRCKEARLNRREITERYDTASGEKTVTGMVTSVRDEIGANQKPKWRVAIKPTTAPTT